jgi:hypothetical protein
MQVWKHEFILNIDLTLNQDSLDVIAMSWTAVSDFWQGQVIFLYSTASRLALGCEFLFTAYICKSHCIKCSGD